MNKQVVEVMDKTKCVELMPVPELLRLAAQAANVGPVLCYESQRNCLRVGSRDSYRLWRPLTCSNDNLLLMAQLGMSVSIEGRTAKAAIVSGGHEASFTSSDPVSALRQAVLLAAAKQGYKSLQGVAA